MDRDDSQKHKYFETKHMKCEIIPINIQNNIKCMNIYRQKYKTIHGNADYKVMNIKCVC